MGIQGIWRGIKWIGGMTWMAAKRDMELVQEAQWEQDDFLEYWIPRKASELDFIGIVVCIIVCWPSLIQLTPHQGGLVAAVVTTCLGLPGIEDSHWLVPGSWYCTLIFSIGSVALAFQQKGALSGVALGKAIRQRNTPSLNSSRLGDSDSSTPVLTSQLSFEPLDAYDIAAWQAPVQLLTYALGFLFFGLLLFLGQSLVSGPWGPRPKVCGVCPILVVYLPILTYGRRRSL